MMKARGQRRENGLLIVTGLSGSGKTAVSRFLEDLGYYCVDNLPAKLIPSFLDLWHKKKVEIERAALIVDIREPSFLTDFPKVFYEIRKKIPTRLVFLEASDECLVKRFSESRRPHPLSRSRSILEGVRQERRRLTEIKKMADDVIDTSALSVSDLKELITEKVLRKKSRHLRIVIISFGYKYGIPLDSDLVFDTRFLPNPFYVDHLRDKNGKARSVREYVLHDEEARRFVKEINDFISRLIPRFVKEGKSTLTISIGCTGGRHRSVVVADKLGRQLREKKLYARIFHRDIYK